MRLEERAGTRKATMQATLAPTVFHEGWWLQAASGGAYREASVSSGGRLIGRLPYVLTTKSTGHRAVTMPDLTPELGPALLVDAAGEIDTHALKRFNTTRDLIAQLPRASHSYFELHRSTVDTMAFDAAGFATTVRYTVEIPAKAEDVLWSQMRDKTRNVIRRAQERLSVVALDDAGQFLDFYDANIQDRRLVNYHRREVCLDVLRQSLAWQAGRILVAVDPSGGHQAAIFTVWDQGSEYYMMTTRSLASVNGAVSLLIWEAIKHAAATGRRFDLMGIRDSMMLNFFTGFGGAIKPRFIVSRSSAAFGFARSVKAAVKHNPVSAALHRVLRR